MFIHAGEYLGTEKSIVTLTNYEANTGYFPISYKEEMNPFKIIGSVEKNAPTPNLSAYQEKTKDWGGEDFQLFRKLRKAGHRVLIDLNLSMHVAHIGMFAFTEKLEENRKKK